MIRTRSLTTVLMLFLALVAGCAKKASQEIDFGVVTDSVYRNQFFGMSITFPEEWWVQDAETHQETMQESGRMFAGDDPNLQAALKASELTTVQLFAVMEHPIGTPVPFNPNLIALAERVRNMTGIQSGKDYLYHARKLMEASQMSYIFSEELDRISLGGVEFDVLRGRLDIGPFSVHQKFYSAIMKGYALGLVVSFSTEEEEMMLNQILETLSFEAQ